MIDPDHQSATAADGSRPSGPPAHLVSAAENPAERVAADERALRVPTPEQRASAIEALRGEIDALDAEIARLVIERARVSVRVQAARISAGGTRVELGRERVILDHYRATLGHDGPSLAEAVLRVCRGTR